MRRWSEPPSSSRSQFKSDSRPGEVVDPSDGEKVGVVVRALPQHVVLQVEHRQLVVDEDSLWQVLEVAARQVGRSWQLVRRLTRYKAAMFIRHYMGAWPSGLAC